MPRLTLQETMDRLLLNVQAGHPVIYLVTHEESRVLSFLLRLFRVILQGAPTKQFLWWTDEGESGLLRSLVHRRPAAVPDGPVDWLKVQRDFPTVGPTDRAPTGMRRAGAPTGDPWSELLRGNPAEILRRLQEPPPQAIRETIDSISVFFDLHPFLSADAYGRLPHGSLVRPLRNTAARLRTDYEAQRDARANPGDPFPYRTIFIVAPTAANLSSELDRDLLVLDFPLPEAEELRQALDLVSGPGRPLPYPPGSTEDTQKHTRDAIANAGRGLTLDAYRLGLNTFAVRREPLNGDRIEDMLNLKANVIRSPALEYTPHVEIELGGLQVIMDWVKKRRDLARYDSLRTEFNLPPLQGVMLCGVSGGGKSMLAKKIAKDFNLALLRLDVGALFGSYIGESERRTREALQLAEELAPVILWIDEIDKAFSGIHDGGDNGVSARVFGHLLTWLAEKTASVFVVTTANDHTKLLESFPEFGRKGRFDDIFWVDLPGSAQREEILLIYLKPHFASSKNLFAFGHDGVDALADAHKVKLPSDGDEAKRLAEVLSHANLSNNMTGAELEQVINECVTEAYYLRRAGAGADDLIAKLGEVFVDAMNRALYNPRGPAYTRLTNFLRPDANERGWLNVI
jgi:hypothetical protein